MLGGHADSNNLLNLGNRLVERESINVCVENGIAPGCFYSFLRIQQLPNFPVL